MSPASRLEEILEELQRIGAESDREDIENEHRAFEEELAKQNRSGERGPDWVKLQQRIDLHQTTFSAILSGEDTSPEARRVMAYAQRNLSALRDEMVEESERDEEATNPIVETTELLEEIDRKVSEIQARFGSL